ncbi:MAG: phenylalanine--tRNA ligase subunit beta [Rubrobacteraceae bacterium]
MRVPLSWLREYMDFDLTVDELVDLLSLHSQEVDGVERMGVLDGEVVVGEVVEFEPHPNADRLSVAKVDLGGQTVQIVAGAPNPYPSVRVPVVLPGSTVAGVGKLKKAKLRGLESYGMMMSERELGISGDHGGILLLDESYEVGHPVEEYFPVGETVLEIDVMPNRPDLWGMIGVARELAAILKTSFRIPEPDIKPGGEPTSDFGLRVEAEDLCPRYDLRRVSNLTPGEKAPLVMRRRVYAAGMRPINAIVDATNYVMLETGQPIHAFDASRVHEGLVVRRAGDGEKITLLDGSTRTLGEEMLVIADEDRGLVIAGVMGAEDAEVGDETTDALIEVATFDGRNILETSQSLGLRTDASGRFERGLDPNMADFAMERVVGLLTGHAQGRAAPDTLSHYPEPVAALEVPMRLERAELLLGMPVGGDEAAERLSALGCEVRRGDGRLLATVPTFRRDLRREVDLVEEVGRLVGLDNVPDVLPATASPGRLTPDQRKIRLLRRLLADLGLTEAITYPFGPNRWLKDLNLADGDAVTTMPELKNPLSEEASNLRPMLLPSLLDAVALNRSFGARGGALFEVGRVFEPEAPSDELRDAALHFRMTGQSDDDSGSLVGMKEPARVGAVLFGATRPKGWNVPERRAGFYEARGVVERLVPGASFEPHAQPFLHPGRSAGIFSNGAEAGWVGELHPEVLERFGLDGWPVAAFELDLTRCRPDPEPHFEPFVNVPAVNRDLAVILDRQIPIGDVLAIVNELRSQLLTETRVFDVYEGSQVPEDKKSLALSFTFQGEETLTDAVVNEELALISSRLGDRFGAQVRDS